MARHHGHRLSRPGTTSPLETKNPAPFRVRGWLLVAHPSYKLNQQHFDRRPKKAPVLLS